MNNALLHKVKDPFFRLLPGKSGQGKEGRWLPFYIHAEDTAGILEKLLSGWLSERTKQTLCLEQEEQERICRFLALVHDIGKLTPAFLARILPSLPELQEQLKSVGIIVDSDVLRKGCRHALASAVILHNYECPPGIVSVVGAHHGKPITKEQDGKLTDLLQIDFQCYYGAYGKDSPQGQRWEAFRRDWFNYALSAAGYSSAAELPQLDIPTQMLMTGLLIMADWISSNQEYFPLINLEDRGEALEQERRVWNAWRRFDPRDLWSPLSVYPEETWFMSTFGFSPNIEQKTAMEAAGECFTPGIFILEAQMGRGKTEAALAIAEILAGKLGCSGLFFGLPTQATANGIFPRLKDWGDRQADNLTLTIRLAHGMASLNEDYRALFFGDSAVDDDGDGGLLVHPWFRGKKQVLLSDFVIGTIDQLLMAALKQKHLMLRHLGLSGKVVILDECHAYDAYMNEYLDRALNWMGQYGVPVVILSATLPAERRAALVDAYLNKNPVQTPGEESWRNRRDYPLLTWTQGDAVRQKAIPMEGPVKNVFLGRLEDADLSSWLQDHLRKGGCAGVIVNTVRRAQDLAKELERTIPEATVEVFHSQFIQPDRAEKEAELVSRLGKESVSAERDRYIVVGTQVLEQSLDIDFDCMVTDLCPMDLLLQRIGRLHRHNRQDRPASLRKPVCMVMGASGDDLDSGSKTVYGRWLLLRTKELLPEVVTLPDSIPDLVQETYSAPDRSMLDQEEMQAAWEEYVRKRDGKESRADAYRIPKPKKRKRLRANTINGWLDTGVTDHEAGAEAKVRDAASSIQVLVMRKETTGKISFLPWRGKKADLSCSRMPEEETARAIAAQRMNLPGVFSHEGVIDRTIQTLEESNMKHFPEWQKASWLQGELILLLDDSNQCELCGYSLYYDRKTGLHCHRTKEEGK